METRSGGTGSSSSSSTEAPPEEAPFPVFDDLIDGMFVPIHPNLLPTKHRSGSAFELKEKQNSKIPSFHEIFQAKKLNPSSASFFFKKNQPDKSQPYSAYMPELESFCWGCYHFLVPNYVPQSTRAIYHPIDKENNYIGVSSKAIPHFKSTRELPLRESDLVCTILDKGITIDDLEKLDHETPTDDRFNLKDDEDTLVNLSIENDNWVRISIGDLRRYRMMKGLASGLMASYLFEEDDLHKGNMSSDGKRIDFDMSLWSILSKFKSSTFGDALSRKNNLATRYTIHEDDIRKFPNLQHATPYYWPTRAKTLSGYIASIKSSNPWEADENKIYAKLAENPVFNYFKFQTLLKFILSGADIYHHIAELHVRPDIMYENKYIVDILSEHLRCRIQSVKDTVINMPEFAQFITNHGASAFLKIRADIEANNQHYKLKSEKMNIALSNPNEKNSTHVLIAKKESYQKQSIDLRAVTAKYDEINRLITKKNENAQIPKMIATLQSQLQATATVSTSPVFSLK